MSRYLNRCKNGGNHDLKEITRNYLDNGVDEVVNWCKICGAVVVDEEVDGRTIIGKMKFPEITVTKNYEIKQK